MKQMDRRLLILTRLREEMPLRAKDLAEECECSVRTVYRDIDALCQAGIPVAAMPGEGYRLAPGFHLPPIAFTVDEAVQLLLGSDLALGLGTSVQREGEPYQLVYYENDWHLLGYCRLREGMRDFRAGRIRAAEALDETFSRHPAVASEARREDWSDAREVRVWLDASAVPWAREKPGFGLEREEQAEGR